MPRMRGTASTKGGRGGGRRSTKNDKPDASEEAPPDVGSSPVKKKSKKNPRASSPARAESTPPPSPPIYATSRYPTPDPMSQFFPPSKSPPLTKSPVANSMSDPTPPSSTSMAGEEVAEPIRPFTFRFNSSEYKKNYKEKMWFQEHRQLRHIFHMVVTHSTRNVMGLWMLLLRTTMTEKKKQVWFVVNGVPIRYFIREHALFSGLDCHEYPENYENLESLRFARNCFGDDYFDKKGRPKLTVGDVESAILKIGQSNFCLKMVLYFLTTVIKGRSNVALAIKPFLVIVVDDLDL